MDRIPLKENEKNIYEAHHHNLVLVCWAGEGLESDTVPTSFNIL